MSEATEQTIVINDLLSFISCKIKLYPRERFIKCLKEFYSESAAIEAEKTLAASLPDNVSLGSKLKNEKNIFSRLCKSFLLVPEEELPIFVCKNLNNVPKLETDEDESHDDDDDDSEDLINEQKFIKAQIAEISSVVYQLKDQIQLLAAQRSKNKSSDGPSSRKNKNILIKEANVKSKLVVPKKIKNASSQKSPKGLAYLQTLIDQEEEEKVKRLSVKQEPGDDIFSDIDEKDDEDYEEEIDSLEDEDDDNTLQLIANRRQRALVKNMESEVLNGKKVSAPIKPVIGSSNSFKRKSINNEVLSKISRRKINKNHDDEENNSDHDDEYKEAFGIEDEEEEVDMNDVDEKESGRKRSGHRDKSHINIEEVFDENVGTFSIYKCTLCNFSTNDEAAIERHDCPQVRVATCCFCNVVCNNADEFNNHLKIHSKVKPRQKYECLLCMFMSEERLELVEHMKEHSWVKPFKCQLANCKFTCTDESRYKNHIIYHKEEDTPNFYNCHICGKYFGNRTNLDKHKSRHSKAFEYVCNFCHISFTKKAALNHHIFIYSKERSLLCLICFRLFNSKSALQIHELKCQENTTGT